MTDQEVKKFKHEDSGYHWERKKVKDKEIEGWLKVKDKEPYVVENMNRSPADKRFSTDLVRVLNRCRNKKVRIKIEAWKDEEVKEKTSFDPFSDKECPECGRPLSLKKGVKYCSHCGWNKDAPIFDEIKLQD